MSVWMGSGKDTNGDTVRKAREKKKSSPRSLYTQDILIRNINEMPLTQYNISYERNDVQNFNRMH
jgi:hypothetical protein